MKDILKNTNNNLFLTTSNTELTNFAEEVFELGELYPEIYRRIEVDQDVRGKLKKRLRKLDKLHAQGKTLDLPGFKNELGDVSIEELRLEDGRPRMRPELVLLFMCLRGYWGSVTDRNVCDRMRDSRTLYVFFGNLNIKLPSPTTILENVNCLSQDTRDFILKCQLEQIMQTDLDDFSYILLDSTAVKASSCWPTDAGVIHRLLNRAYTFGQRLEKFGIKSIPPFYFKDWMRELKELLFKINNVKGTEACSKKKKLQKLYRDFLKTSHKAYEYLLRIFELRSVVVKGADFPPSVKLRLMQLHDNIENDLLALSTVLYYSEERIFNNVSLPSSEKILSLSDLTAAYIKKGQRNPVIGYKPQLCQSKNGFVSGMLLEQGNTSDSASLCPLTKTHTENTGVVPKFISADDGYSSGKGRKECLGLGVEDVCLSGAVGRKITPEALWESEEYIAGRKKRSAIESLMFTLKYVFEFGGLRRRGIENVKGELTEKIIAYNFRRKLMLQEDLQRKKEKQRLKKTA